MRYSDRNIEWEIGNGGMTWVLYLSPDMSGSQSARVKSGHTIGRSCSHCDSMENDLI